MQNVKLIIAMFISQSDDNIHNYENGQTYESIFWFDIQLLQLFVKYM